MLIEYITFNILRMYRRWNILANEWILGITHSWYTSINFQLAHPVRLLRTPPVMSSISNRCNGAT